MKLSVIIPAYNEEKLIAYCLENLAVALASVTDPVFESELIVVDNNSTDRTAEIAKKAGAAVVFEPINQIARARNRGTEAAAGEWLLFVDADTWPGVAVLRNLRAVIERGGAVGGGSTMRIDSIPRAARILEMLWNFISPRFGWAAGGFFFCRADAFHELGGFSGELFASEEIDFSRRLGRWGRARGLHFVILKGSPVLSSGRKAKIYSGREMLVHTWRMFRNPRKALRSREDCKIWYDGRR